MTNDQLLVSLVLTLLDLSIAWVLVRAARRRGRRAQIRARLNAK